jgi:hypothetical protein
MRCCRFRWRWVWGFWTRTGGSPMRTCKGCGAVVRSHPRARKPRRWCSEACRVRTHRLNHPEYAARQSELASARYAEWKATREVPSHELTCAECGVTFKAPRRRLYCSMACRYHQAYRARRARANGAIREVYTAMQIAERDAWRCGICSELVDPALRYPNAMSRSIDHIIPLASGGSDTADNVQLAHLGCNWSKGDRVP